MPPSGGWPGLSGTPAGNARPSIDVVDHVLAQRALSTAMAASTVGQFSSEYHAIVALKVARALFLSRSTGPRLQRGESGPGR